MDTSKEDFLPFMDFELYDTEEQQEMASALVGDPKRQYGQRKSREEYITWLQNKTKRAAIEIVNLMEKTGNSPGINVVRYQIIKSATSTAANYRAACRARSKNEFYAKLCIVVEEADETLFWLEILAESDINVDTSTVRQFQKEWLENH